MVTIENGPVWPSPQGDWFSGAKRAFERLSWESAENFELTSI